MSSISTNRRRYWRAEPPAKKIEAGLRRPSRQMAAQFADVLRLEGAERAQFLAAARSIGEQDPSRPTMILGAGQDDPPVPVTAVVHRSLPDQITPFIGRAHELGDLVARLCDPAVRLVTLIAPGGMGKTRLALAAAEQLQRDRAFPHGVAFAALAPVNEPASLDSNLADALGLPLESAGRSPLVQLRDYLREKQLLLVLDNCEHLREAVAELAGTIMAAAPGPRSGAGYRPA